MQLNDSVVDIAHMPEGKVFAALADGSVAVLQVLGIELSILKLFSLFRAVRLVSKTPSFIYFFYNTACFAM